MSCIEPAMKHKQIYLTISSGFITQEGVVESLAKI